MFLISDVLDCAQTSRYSIHLRLKYNKSSRRSQIIKQGYINTRLGRRRSSRLLSPVAGAGISVEAGVRDRRVRALVMS